MDSSTDELAEQIHDTEGGGEPVSTRLTTHERVLARVTDGIYRQPGSALRELAANAYDADATQVVITTDRPRFEQIRIEDDGLGMTPEVVAYLLRNIGGSAKRNMVGTQLGVTDADPRFSPGGRRLIGKVGIGLFSVAQLTQSFQIITKVAGERFRTVASVALKHYSDDVDSTEPEQEEFEAGIVKIWREPATDVDEHGTSIVLTRIHPQTRQTLSSDGLWRSIEHNEELTDPAERQNIVPPIFHIGRLVGGEGELLRDVGGGEAEHLPWSDDDEPAKAFGQLVEAVWRQSETGIRNPKLEQIFDAYLQMIWRLSLAVPLPYVEGHPFDLPFGETAATYRIPDGSKASLERLELREGETLRDRLGLTDGPIPDGTFRVLIDGLELSRPLKFEGLPVTHNAVTHPVIAVGVCEENFEGIPLELSGGPLHFEAYLMWNSKILPVEHQGVLVRIYGASGTLFDTTFMRYEVAEQTRLRQTTCEVLVSRGLEAALNIDRESFNFAHPHAVYLTRWLHNALRRLHTTQKSIADKLRAAKRGASAQASEQEMDRIVADAWSDATADEDEQPPRVSFDPQPNLDDEDGYYFDRDNVFGTGSAGFRTAAQRRVERQVAAIAKVLSGYGFLDQLSSSEQEALLNAIRRILEVE